MRNLFSSGVIRAAVLSACAGSATLAFAASPTATVPGNVATWVKNAKASGTAAASKSVTVTVHLQVRNPAALKSIAQAVSDPKSKSYGHYLTNEAFAAQFAPQSADVAAVEALLTKGGMQQVAAGPHGMFVTATATVAQLASTFHVTQSTYSFRGVTLRANSQAPTIPAALAGKVLYVAGLDDSGTLRKPRHVYANAGRSPTPAAAASLAAESLGAEPDAAAPGPKVTPPPVATGVGSPYCNVYYGADELVATLTNPADVYGSQIPWLNCGYTPHQIQEAYGIKGLKTDGTGVTVAIVDAYASPTLMSDLNRYSTKHALPAVTSKNFQQIYPSGIYNVDPAEECDPQGWWGEQAIDVDAVHGVAPGADILYVGSRDCNVSLDNALFGVVYKHLADIVSNSWGFDGEPVPAADQATFDQAMLAGAVQGMSVLVASGDDGDVAALTGVASGSWPATSPWVTGVGGTSLLLEDNSGQKKEAGWGTYRALLDNAKVKSAKLIDTSGPATVTNFGATYSDFSYYAGAGGGISLIETQPFYQAGTVSDDLSTTLWLASGTPETLPARMRVSPDIAMLADPYTGFIVGETYTIAGTVSDAGCQKLTKTQEYCEVGVGGTSVASPLMAGVLAILNQKRRDGGEPVVGFANPLLYHIGGKGNGQLFRNGINDVLAPQEPMAVLRGYSNDLTEVRVVTINSVPFNIATAPYAILVCGNSYCDGINDQFNFTSKSVYGGTGRGYNDVTGLGVPWVKTLLGLE